MQTFMVQFRGDNKGGKNELLSFDAELRENMVPQDATAVFISPEADKIEQAFAAFLENNPVKGTISVAGRTSNNRIDR